MLCYISPFAVCCLFSFFCFFFNDTATTEIYTLSLHDALPIYRWPAGHRVCSRRPATSRPRSEEHTSELQSPCNLVCRLLLEKKTTTRTDTTHYAPTRRPRTEPVLHPPR